jgi:hypothetical protein
MIQLIIFYLELLLENPRKMITVNKSLPRDTRTPKMILQVKKRMEV